MVDPLRKDESSKYKPEDWQRARLDVLVSIPSKKTNYCFVGRVVDVMATPSFHDCDDVIDMDSVRYKNNKITNKGTIVHWEGNIVQAKYMQQKKTMFSAKRNKRLVTVMIKNGDQLHKKKLCREGHGRIKHVAGDKKTKNQRTLAASSGILSMVPRVARAKVRDR